MSAFTQKEIEYGRCEVESGCTVQIYESRYQRRALPNPPCGKIKDAYWQNGSVHVLMADGRHYVYNEFGNYSTYWNE